MSSKNWFLSQVKRLGVRDAEDYVINGPVGKGSHLGSTARGLRSGPTKIQGILEDDVGKIKEERLWRDEVLKKELRELSKTFQSKLNSKISHEGKVTLPHYGQWTFITKKGNTYVCSVDAVTFETDNFWDAMIWISNQFGVDINEDSNGNSQA